MNKILVVAVLLLVLPFVSAQDSGNSSGISLDPREYIEIESSDHRTNSTGVFNREGDLNLPLGYIALILAFLGIVVYSVDVDPFWIIILLFFLVLSAAVYYLGLPLHIIPVVITVLIGVAHFR